MSILLPIIILSAMGVVFGLGLAFASKAFDVKQDERIEAIRGILPGANCAACGYSGCDGYAFAIVEGEATPSLCPVGGQPLADSIGTVMGVKAGAVTAKVARVKCGGGEKACKRMYDYKGIQDCAAVKLLHGGQYNCDISCEGFGNCVKACEYDAIYINEGGVADVIAARCVACGKCAKACPKNLIDVVPVESFYTVRCSSNDRGVDIRKACGVGCIGCGRCVKTCLYNAIRVENNLAAIDPYKCTNCGECAKACPRKCIVFYE